MISDTKNDVRLEHDRVVGIHRLHGPACLRPLAIGAERQLVLVVDLDEGRAAPVLHVGDVGDGHARQTQCVAQRVRSLHDRVEIADHSHLGRKHDAGREVATAQTNGERLLGRLHPSRPYHEAGTNRHGTSRSVLGMTYNDGNYEIVNHGDVGRVDRQPTLNILAHLEEESEGRRRISREVVVLDLAITRKKNSHTAVKQQRVVLLFC